VQAGRRGIGIELKPSYYRQAVRNLELSADATREVEQPTLFGEDVSDPDGEE
jgi:hypothetical protein